jgi:hypothetical protein
MKDLLGVPLSPSLTAKFALPPPAHVMCTPQPAGVERRIRIMTPPPAMKGTGSAMKGTGSAMKGTGSAMKAMKAMKAGKKGKKRTSMKGTPPPASQGEILGTAMKGAGSAMKAGKRPTAVTDVHVGEGDESADPFDAEPMDFSLAANCTWAKRELSKAGVELQQPAGVAAAARLRKQQVRTRPNNRLVQILVSGKVWGQVTETAYGRTRVMKVANVLLFVASAGYDRSEFALVKQAFLPKPAD